MPHNKQNAFTLIELLIVVAIIAILAAIAVPNFLEAQVRSKVSRVKSDLRTFSIGLEAYFVDSNNYPIGRRGKTSPDFSSPGTADRGLDWTENCLVDLTTPVAYMTSVAMKDPFSPKLDITPGAPVQFNASYAYYPYSGLWVMHPNVKPYLDSRIGGYHKAWCVQSYGPDKKLQGMAWIPINYPQFPQVAINEIYDATNGTMSGGDIGRFGGDIQVPAAVK